MRVVRITRLRRVGHWRWHRTTIVSAPPYTRVRTATTHLCIVPATVIIRDTPLVAEAFIFGVFVAADALARTGPCASRTLFAVVVATVARLCAFQVTLAGFGLIINSAIFGACTLIGARTVTCFYIDVTTLFTRPLRGDFDFEVTSFGSSVALVRLRTASCPL